MVTYFVCRTVSDGLPAGDFKAINNKAKGLYECGHIQNIQVCSILSSSSLWVRSDCLPEMKKNEVYKIRISLSDTTYDLLSAECGCKAGKGPKESCKHIGALCYALVEFCKSGQLPEFRTCTEVLQQWNKPRPKKVEVIPVDEIGARRKEILTKNEQNSTQQVKYNPIPHCLRTQSRSDVLTENLRVDLLKFNPTCGLLQLLAPSVKVALHDLEYTGDDHSLEVASLGEVEGLSSEVLCILPEEAHYRHESYYL